MAAVLLYKQENAASMDTDYLGISKYIAILYKYTVRELHSRRRTHKHVFMVSLLDTDHNDFSTKVGLFRDIPITPKHNYIEDKFEKLSP